MKGRFYMYDDFNGYQSPDNNGRKEERRMAEVTYYPNSDPEVRPKNRHTLAKGIALVLCMALVSVGSIAAYEKVTGEKESVPSAQANTTTSAAVTEAAVPAVTEKSKSFIELAARSDAMAVSDIYEKVKPSVVGISCTISNGYQKGTATGTGIIMTNDGYIITNAHVVDNAVDVMVVLDDESEYDGKIVGADEQTDLAVIKIDAANLTAAEFGNSDDLRVGDLAIVIGNPLGFELSNSLTGGFISALNREVTINDQTMTLIQTDASVNSGNSGGPLVNCYGQVVGIVSAKIGSSYYSSTSVEGLGFAIPITDSLPIIDDLINFGYVKGRPMLGISGENIDSLTARYYNIPQGVLVRATDPDSGAAKAGIEEGDIIIGINGEAIQTMDELNNIKNNFKAGDTVTITVARQLKDIDFTVVLSEAKG